MIESLLRVRDVLRQELRTIDRQLLDEAKADPVVRMLMTAPGVGAVVALTFKSAVDDPKAGDAGVRTALYEAATTVLSRVTRWSTIKNWGMRVASRSGAKKARVAIARKLAIVLLTMWRSQTPFRWSATQASA